MEGETYPNITLIDGDKLLEMFKKHNYNFHIDLEQARKNNAMNLL